MKTIKNEQLKNDKNYKKILQNDKKRYTTSRKTMKKINNDKQL